MGEISGDDMEIGFAKLIGDNFEYHMYSSSVIIGRKLSKHNTNVEVDLDLGSLGGDPESISSHHARIFFDFRRRCLAMEVLGRQGCFIDDVLHLPGAPPVKLRPNSLVTIGAKHFYVLPTFGSMGGTTNNEKEVGFAKLIGDNFEYYMQTYSIILGRNSKTSTVDVDLSTLGGGMNISRHHATVFYDFGRHCFLLDVLGRNGCFVNGLHHSPGSPPVELKSRNLLKIGDKEFYFMLPVKSVLSGPVGSRHHVIAGSSEGGSRKRKCADEDVGVGGGAGAGGCGSDDKMFNGEGCGGVGGSGGKAIA